jgi:methionyl aminopeptidase
MRAAGAVAASALIHVAPSVRPGVSTAALDAIVASFIRSSAGGRANAATVGYRGYAHASCVSVNDVVCHGVPSAAKILEEGDVVNVDVTVELDGWHGDTSRTFLVTRFGGWDGGSGDEGGEEGGGGGDDLRSDESSEARADAENSSDPRLRFASIASRFANATRLIRATKRALALGLRSCRAGARIGDVTGPIRASLESEGYGVVDSYAAHGIGRRFHQPPRILHGARRAGSGFELRRGMFFTIEPMANEGTKRTRGPLREDGWSVVTADGGLSAQFEHTVGVGFGADGACEIFTAPPPRRTRGRGGREEEEETTES